MHTSKISTLTPSFGHFIVSFACAITIRLERQFCYAGKTSTRHWFQYNFHEMVDILKRFDAEAIMKLPSQVNELGLSP